jgi:hypothetical protein
MIILQFKNEDVLTLEQLTAKERKALRNKMAEVFGEKIKNLPAEVQYILLDDVVTAFESRLSIFSHAKPGQVLAHFELALNNEEIFV